jgi:hypothetical protein
MLNNYSVYNKAFTNIKVNAISGTLIKSHPMSFIKSFHNNSELANNLFSSKPKYDFARKPFSTDFQEVVVLQIMLTGADNHNMLAEIVKLKDYLQKESEEE